MSKQHDDGGQAYPMSGDPEVEFDRGMTLLDYFAATCEEPFSEESTMEWAAEASGISPGAIPPPTGTAADHSAFWAEAIARARYLKAEAMLRERRRREAASDG